jgi:hypothetical protein
LDETGVYLRYYASAAYFSYNGAHWPLKDNDETTMSLKPKKETDKLLLSTSPNASRIFPVKYALKKMKRYKSRGAGRY